MEGAPLGGPNQVYTSRNVQGRALGVELLPPGASGAPQSTSELLRLSGPPRTRVHPRSLDLLHPGETNPKSQVPPGFPLWEQL